MQKPEPSMLEQLEKNRQRQASAMKRLALAQERIAQIETRLQSLHKPAQSTPSIKQTANPQPEQNISLPINGDLESQSSFSPTPADMGLEPTDRLPPLKEKSRPLLPATPIDISDKASQEQA